MNFKFGQYLVKPVFARYYNGNTAILFVGDAGTEYEGEEICRATVNGNVVFEDANICGFKSWNEGPEVVRTLVENGIIETPPLFEEPSGFGYIRYHKLTEKGARLREKYRLK